MAINAQHPDYKDNVDLWETIEHVVDFDDVEEFLIPLNPNDQSVDNQSRNKQYKLRAIFYAVCGWTVRGMLGTMFAKWPVLNVPPQMEYLKTNADGAGNSIYQLSQSVSKDVISIGRNGLCVSFPEKPSGSLSQADIQTGKYIATIHEYDAGQIINWATKQIGAQVILSLVCTAECKVEIVDYEHKSTNIIRERFIDDQTGFYNERVWTEELQNGIKTWIPSAPTMPTDANGNFWKIIPFIFVGSESNTPDVDMPPMKELAHINIGHYRNSADWEDTVWYAGQAQPWMSGITQDHVDLMKKNNMYAGSRMVMGVPSGEQFAYANADANPATRQAMIDKIELMIGLGARFLTPGSAVKTATQAGGELQMQHSVLSLIASNVSEAFTQCLKWCAIFNGADQTDLAYTISQDFVKPTADAQMLQQMVASWMQGALPSSDLFQWMRKNELIDSEKTDEQINEELAAGGTMPAVAATL